VSDAAIGEERLRQLYDPDYVRRVALPGDTPIQVCLESRLVKGRGGTGVASYARSLAACLPEAGAGLLLLSDGDDQGQRPRARMRRWLAATGRQTRRAVAAGPEPSDAPQRWIAQDLFKEAQVFFNLHGRLLPVEFAVPPQMMHWTYPLPLYLRGARNLYTIHDLIPLTDSALTTIRATRHRAILGAIAAQAHRLVTVSESVRAEVIAQLGVSGDRVINTWQTVDAPVQVDPSLPRKLRPGRYFLFCGRVEGRKNLERLAEAHADSGAALPLVVVGPGVAGEGALETKLQARPGIVRIPWVPRPQLLGMLRCARALLFPSLAEGFGLPILEAMTLGCPVLASTIPAACEVAGDAALLMDPHDVEALAAAIAQLATDDLLCARLRTKGFARSRFFSRDQYARRLRALYADALGGADDVAAAAPMLAAAP
jgi:glycosyltransferase involved in cell wall biosynthesis